MFRKIRLTVKAKDLSEVMKSLDLPTEYLDNIAFTVDVDIMDTKENYKTLSTSENILDWTPLHAVDPEIPATFPDNGEDNKPEVEKKPVDEGKNSASKSSSLEEDIHAYLSGKIQSKNELFIALYLLNLDILVCPDFSFHGGLTISYLDAVLRKYTSTLGDVNVTDPNATVQRFVFEKYYQDTNLQECLKDVSTKLVMKWPYIVEGARSREDSLLAILLDSEPTGEKEEKSDYTCCGYSVNIIELEILLHQYRIYGHNVSDLVYVLYSLWELSKRSPGISFTPEVVRRYILKVPTSPLSKDDVDYFSNLLEGWLSNFDEAGYQMNADLRLTELLRRIEGNWKTFGSCSDFMEVLRRISDGQIS